MNIDLSEEQEMLRKTARDFLTKEVPAALVRQLEEDDKGYTLELWSKMAQMGWMGLVIPEEYGGSGGSFLNMCILLEEMGRVCLPGPFFSSVVLGGYTLLEAGDSRHNKVLLPKLANGSVIFTLALTEPDMKWTTEGIQTKADKVAGEYVISGTKLFVPDANVADYIIVVARTKARGENSIFILDGASLNGNIRLLKTIAGDKQCEIILNKFRVSAEKLLGKESMGSEVINRVLEKAAVAKCAEMVGAAQKVLEMTAQYAKERVQFGKAIGGFQAVQHHCTNMLIAVDGARFITYQAAWMLSEKMPCMREVAMAKAWVSEAFNRVVSLSHQVHGGVGFMQEHDLPLYWKRAKCWSALFGDARFYYETIAKELFD